MSISTRQEASARSMLKSSTQWSSLLGSSASKLVSPEDWRFPLKRLMSLSKKVCDVARLPQYKEMIQCLKIVGDTIVFVASIDQLQRTEKKRQQKVNKARRQRKGASSNSDDDKEPQRAGAIIDFVKRVGEEFTREAGPVPFRAVAGCGPLIGAVVGRGSVSFEYYGPSLTTALHLIELVDYGVAVATSRIVRVASQALSSPRKVDEPTESLIVVKSRTVGKTRMLLVFP